MKTENYTQDSRITGIVKMVKTEGNMVQYAYIKAGGKDYLVNSGATRRMDNAAEVMVPGKKVSFTVYHGNRDYANDIRPVPVKEGNEKPDLMDISTLTPQAQALVAKYKEKNVGKIDLRKSILTTLNQPGYVNLSKQEYIDTYLERHNTTIEVTEQEAVIELIEHYWAIKKA